MSGMCVLYYQTLSNPNPKAKSLPLRCEERLKRFDNAHLKQTTHTHTPVIDWPFLERGHSLSPETDNASPRISALADWRPPSLPPSSPPFILFFYYLLSYSLFPLQSSPSLCRSLINSFSSIGKHHPSLPSLCVVSGEQYKRIPVNPQFLMPSSHSVCTLLNKTSMVSLIASLQHIVVCVCELGVLVRDGGWIIGLVFWPGLSETALKGS